MTIMNDDVKGYLALIAFFLLLPTMYLAPTILNAITDLVIR